LKNIKMKSVIIILIIFLLILSACAGDSTKQNSEENYAQVTSDPNNPVKHYEYGSIFMENLPDSINAEFISMIGQPFSHFNEKYGWRINDENWSTENINGESVGRYNKSNEIYDFYIDNASTELTDTAFCKTIRTPYINVFNGVSSLTEDGLVRIFGEYLDKVDRKWNLIYLTIDVSENDFVYESLFIKFTVQSDGGINEYIELSGNGFSNG